MINEPLHKLFHDLSGPIGTINTMSQICVSYITTFNMERLEGNLKENLTNAYKDIFFCREKIAGQLKLVIDALDKIESKDVGDTLQEYINHGLQDLKEVEEACERSYSYLLKYDTKENLLRFGEELKGFQPVCQSMVRAMSWCKEKLATAGKY